MKYKIGRYVLRVWLASTVIMGVLFVIIFGLTQQDFKDLTFAHFIAHEVIALMFVFVSLLLSIPAQAIFYYAARLLVNWVDDPLKQKICFNIIAVAVMIGTFCELFIKVPSYDKSFYHPLIAGYAVIISCCVWWFKLKPIVEVVPVGVGDGNDFS
jgi:branched-subunit amino acid transport protein AzlD